MGSYVPKNAEEKPLFFLSHCCMRWKFLLWRSTVAQVAWIPTTWMNFGLLVYKKCPKANDNNCFPLYCHMIAQIPTPMIYSTSLPFNNMDEYWAVMYKKESTEIISLWHLLSFIWNKLPGSWRHQWKSGWKPGTYSFLPSHHCTIIQQYNYSINAQHWVVIVLICGGLSSNSPMCAGANVEDIATLFRAFLLALATIIGWAKKSQTIIHLTENCNPFFFAVLHVFRGIKHDKNVHKLLLLQKSWLFQNYLEVL